MCDLMKNKLFILLLILMLSSLVSAQTPFLPFNHLKVSSSSFNPSTIYPGDSVSLSLIITNNASNITAENAYVSVSLPKEFNVILNSYNISMIKQNSSETAILKFAVNNDIIPGNYNIPVNITYISQGNKVESTTNFTLSVSKLSKLNISDISLNSKYFYPNDSITISTKIFNESSFDESKVIVKLVPTTEKFDGFNLSNESTILIESLKSKSSNDLHFQLIPSKDLAPGFYSFSITATSSDNLIGDNEPFSIQIKGKPDLVLSSLDFSVANSKEKKILQGSVFSVSLQLENIGKEKAKGVKAILSSPDDIIGPKETFIGTIDPNDTSSAVFDLSALNDAKEGKHNFKLTLSYIDESDSIKTIDKTFDLYIFAKPPEPILPTLIIILLILVALYFIIQLIFRQLRLQKHHKST